MGEPFIIQAAGIAFNALRTGKSPPDVVFLHGFGGDLRTWDTIWAAMTAASGAAFSTLRYDLRGFGATVDSLGQPFSHADDLLAVLDACSIGRCDLVGVSMGGSVALNFALDHPERVRSLILISPAIVAWEWSEAWRSMWKSIVVQARAGNLDAARRLWWQHPLFATTRRSAAGPTFRDAIMRFSGQPWVRNHERPALPDVERLHALAVPTLLLTGSEDLADFRLIAELIEASAPELVRIDLPAAGHLLYLEQPERCADELLRFMRSIKERDK